MFRDTSKELARLEAELLAEEEPEEVPSQEEEEILWPYEDTRPAGGPGVYQNYSNDYGKNLRNYASGYHAYNTDQTDDDLERYSEDVYKGKPKTGCLAVAVCLLSVAIAAAAILWLAYERGLL